MFENVNAALENLQFADGEIQINLESAAFEFNLEDNELVGLLSNYESFERDLESLEDLQAVLEKTDATEGLMAFINKDNNLAQALGISIPEVTTENAHVITQATLEGIGNTIARTWNAIIAFFKNLIIRIKAWFIKVISFRGSLEKKLVQCKTKLADVKNLSSKFGEKDYTGYSNTNFVAIVTDLNAFIDVFGRIDPAEGTTLLTGAARASALNTVFGKEIKAATDEKGTKLVAAKNSKQIQTQSGTLAKLGWTDKTIAAAVDSALDTVKKAKKLEGMEGKISKEANDAIANARKNIGTGKENSEEYKKARKEARNVGCSTQLVTMTYRKVIEMGRAALALGNKVIAADIDKD